MRSFAGARYVVGIHGAGLVNLIFRQAAPLGLLELFPPDNLQPHYFWICRHYGCRYQALAGAAAPGEQAFRIDPALLRRALALLLAA